MKFIHENPRADNITIVDFMDCAEQWVRRPWRFPITGSDTLVMKLSMYKSCALNSDLPAVCLDLDILISYRMPLFIVAAACFVDHF